MLRDAVRAEPARDGREPRLGRGPSREAQRPGRGGRVQGRAQGRPGQPRRARRAGARRRRRPLRRRGRARRAAPRARREPRPRRRARVAGRAGARRRELGRRRRGRRRDPPHEPDRRRRGARRGRRRRCCSTIGRVTNGSATADLAVRPNDGDFFAFVAEALTHHRRYDDARAVANEGVSADPDDAGCLAALAMTLLRLGDETAGLDALRRAWKRDPYDVRTYNLLNLYEKAIPARYTMVERAHLRFRDSDRQPHRDHGGRRPVPGGDAIAISSPAIGVEPPGPVILELYGDPHEFAVRTTGLPAHRRRGRLLRAGHHVAGAQQPCLQLGDGADARAGARVRDPAVAVARAALVHRGPVGAGDGPPEAGVDATRRRGPLRGAADRRASAAGGAVERVRDRAGRRGGARLRARGGGRRLSRAPLRLPGAPRRAGGLRPRRVRIRGAQEDDGAVARMRSNASFAPSWRAASRATTSNICRRSRCVPPPCRPRPRVPAARATGPRGGLGALRAGDLDEAKKALDRARALPQPSADEQADALFLAGEIALAQP